MAKLLSKGIWYSSMSSNSMYESQFESMIISHSENLFPNYYTVPFKKIIQSDIGDAIADLVLVEKNYKSWCIVEVELSHHSLRRHVIPQIEILRRAKYGIEDANYLLKKYSVFDEMPLKRLLQLEQPKYYIFLNENMPSWNDYVNSLEFKISVIEPFISEYGDQILRLDGEQPVPQSAVFLTICNREERSPALLRVQNPAQLPKNLPETLPIWIENGLTLWRLREGPKGILWLQPINRSPFKPEVDAVTLMLYPGGSLVFE